jgi:hypothetical protein
MRRQQLMGDTKIISRCGRTHALLRTTNYKIPVSVSVVEVCTKRPLILRLESSVATTISSFFGCFVTNIV